MAIKKEALKETSWWLAKNKENQHKNAFCRHLSSLRCFVMPHTVIKFGLMTFCELIYHFSRHNCHLLISIGFELFCDLCYWKFLLIVFVVSLHHQAFISCDAKCYFSKLGYQLFLVQCVLKKIKNHKFSIFLSFLVPRMSDFLENGSNG